MFSLHPTTSIGQDHPQRACKDQAGKGPYILHLFLSRTGAFQIFEHSWLLRLMAEADETLTSIIHLPLCSPAGIPPLRRHALSNPLSIVGQNSKTPDPEMGES